MNTCCIIGNIGKDPEIKYFESGKSKATFSVAISKYVKGKDPVTMWISCEAWEKAAETIANHCKQGSRIGIEGRLDVQTWTTPDGQQRSKMIVIVDRPTFCEKKDGAGTSRPTQQTTNPNFSEEIVEDLISEDEIPF